MARVNFWQRAPQSRTAQTRTFQDIDEETGEDRGDPFELTFWRPTEPEITQALELRDKLILRYVGIEEDDIKPEMPFQPVGGKQVIVTAMMCENAAYMQWMQPPFVSAEDRYSAEDFIAMRANLSEQTRGEINAFMKDVRRKKKKAVGETETPTDPASATSPPSESV